MPQCNAEEKEADDWADTLLAGEEGLDPDVVPQVTSPEKAEEEQGQRNRAQSQENGARLECGQGVFAAGTLVDLEREHDCQRAPCPFDGETARQAPTGGKGCRATPVEQEADETRQDR